MENDLSSNNITNISKTIVLTTPQFSERISEPTTSGGHKPSGIVKPLEKSDKTVSTTAEHVVETVVYHPAALASATQTTQTAQTQPFKSESLLSPGIVTITTGITRERGKTEDELISECVRDNRLDRLEDIEKILNNKESLDDSRKKLLTSLLLFSVTKKYWEFARVLINGGAEITSCGKHGETPLMRAAMYGDLQTVQLLVNKAANDPSLFFGLFDAHDKLGHTALTYAALYGRKEIIEKLIEVLIKAQVKLKPYLNTTNNEGQTPLICAVTRGHEKIVQLLINQTDIDLNACDNNGYTALLLAAKGGKENLKQMLIECNADYTTRSTQNRTSLMRAVIAGDEKAVEILVKAGVNLDARDEDGFTAFALAAGFGQVKMMQMLAAAGANVTACSKYNRTPLMWAVIAGQEKSVEMLIKAGNLDARDENGHTAFNLAAGRGQVEIVRMLAAAGANVNACWHGGETPLVYAMAMPSQTEMVRVLREELHASQLYADQFYDIKEAAQIWALKGNVTVTTEEMGEISVPLEGANDIFMLRTLLEQVEAFFRSNPLVLTDHQAEIQKCIANAFPLSPQIDPEVIQKIKSGDPFEPLLILGGSEEHTISMVICKNIY